MSCQIEREISKYTDEPEQLSASEEYQKLMRVGWIHVRGEAMFYDEFIEMLDDDEFENADENEVSKMIVDKIAEVLSDE